MCEIAIHVFIMNHACKVGRLLCQRVGASAIDHSPLAVPSRTYYFPAPKVFLPFGWSPKNNPLTENDAQKGRPDFILPEISKTHNMCLTRNSNFYFS